MNYLERVVGMALELVETCFPLWIPNSDHVVISTGHNHFPIVLDTSDGRTVTKEKMKAFPSLNVQHSELEERKRNLSSAFSDLVTSQLRLPPSLHHCKWKIWSRNQD